MRQTKKDKIVITCTETGIDEYIYEMSEEQEAQRQYDLLVQNDLEYYREKKHTIKIVNAYWNNGIYSYRRG